jgi:hypothetical protein
MEKTNSEEESYIFYFDSFQLELLRSKGEVYDEFYIGNRPDEENKRIHKIKMTILPEEILK